MLPAGRPDLGVPLALGPPGTRRPRWADWSPWTGGTGWPSRPRRPHLLGRCHCGKVRHQDERQRHSDEGSAEPATVGEHLLSLPPWTDGPNDGACERRHSHIGGWCGEIDVGGASATSVVTSSIAKAGLAGWVCRRNQPCQSDEDPIGLKGVAYGPLDGGVVAAPEEFAPALVGGPY